VRACSLLLALTTSLLATGRAAAAGPARKTLAIGGAAIELVIEPGGPRELGTAAIEVWVARAAGAVSKFYGRFPVAHVRVVVSRVAGGRIGGTAYGGRLVRLRIGAAATAAMLADDWTATHEMFHLGFPDLDRRHLWMEEGMATYFEPIARARVGELAPDRVWRELFAGLPSGLGAAGDGGLDDTPTWGATYWGGALFWFLADVRIREATDNRRSADDALRAILAAGGDGTADWEVDKVLEVGDRATGTAVLAGLYQELGRSRFSVDLDVQARRLGVAGGRLDDRAPLAAVRRGIAGR
jgi:hypothetical protein